MLPKTIPHPVGVLHLPAFFPQDVIPIPYVAPGYGENAGTILGSDVPLTHCGHNSGAIASRRALRRGLICRELAVDFA